MIRPILDDLELPHVQEITTYDRRMLAEHKPPGMSGSLLQNVGRRPVRIVLWGVSTGDKALDFASKLDEKFRNRTPVPFSSDIAADAKLDKVLIEDLQLQELAGKPQRVSYVLTLREFIKPIEPPVTTGIDTGILDDASKLVGDIANGIEAAKAAALGLEPFVSTFSSLLESVKKASH